MVYVEIHIDNGGSIFETVSITAALPSVPRIGERVWLTDLQDLELAKLACESNESVRSYVDYIVNNDEPFIDFTECMYVTDVLHRSGEETTHVFISDNRDPYYHMEMAFSDERAELSDAFCEKVRKNTLSIEN